MRKGIVTINPLYWMPLNVDEWLGRLAGGLTAEQKGALMDLLAMAWKQDPPCTLPNDPTYLAQKSGLGPRWSRNERAILAAGGFYPAQGERLLSGGLHELYVQQLEKYRHRSEANAANRAKREQKELDLGAGAKVTKRGTRRGTKSGTNRTTTLSTEQELEGVAPKGANTRPLDAAPEDGARAAVVETPVERSPRSGTGLSSMPPITSILLMAGVPKPGES